MADPSVVSSQPTAGGPQEIGELFKQKLDRVINFDIRQANVWTEGVTAGIWPNTYVISNRDITVPVVNRPKAKHVYQPEYIVKEDSSCCARCWCPGHQTFSAKVYHAKPEPIAGKTECGCCYTGHKYEPDFQAGVAMTLDRKGCCSKWLGCFVLKPCCQDDLYVMPGEHNMPSGSIKAEDAWMGRSLQPMKGGGFTPTVDLFSKDQKAYENQFATVEGPCCYGGWLSLLTDTIYKVSNQKGKAGDIGALKKHKARTCGECCIQMCTNVDQYAFEAEGGYANLTSEQKATVLANVIHLDYMFFENDLPPVYIESDNQGNAILICTLCQMYCYGCCCPVQICIPLGGGN